MHPRFKREFHYSETALEEQLVPLTRSDLTLFSQGYLLEFDCLNFLTLIFINSEWNNNIVGKISPWIDLDSEIEHVRLNSEKAFHEEINYAQHLALSCIMVQLKQKKCLNLAKNLLQHITSKLTPTVCSILN